MEHPNVISGLKKRRAELLAVVQDRELDLALANTDLDAIDRTLKLFGYHNPSDIGPKRSPQRLFANKELSRLVRSITNQSTERMDNPAIAREIINLKGWDAEDVKLYRRVRSSVKDCRKRAEFKPKPPVASNP